MLDVTNKFWFPPNSVHAELGGSFYIRTINSNNTNRKIIKIKEKINKSFLNLLSPPSFLKFGLTQLLNVPTIL